MAAYELLARFKSDGTVSGVSVRNKTTVNGRDYEGDPEPLSGTTDPAYAQFAADFSAAVVAERDSLQTQLTAMTAERDGLATDKTGLTNQVSSLMTERDGLAVDKSSLTDQVAALTTERDGLSADKATLTAQVADLQAQLDALLNPSVNPRHVAPFDFLALFTQAEQVAIFSSVDPTVLLARAQLQTIITYVDLDLPATINFVGYLEQAGLIAAGRAAQVLAGIAPV